MAYGICDVLSSATEMPKASNANESKSCFLKSRFFRLCFYVDPLDTIHEHMYVSMYVHTVMFLAGVLLINLTLHN